VQVEVDAAIRRRAGQVQPLERLDDLDPVAADLLLQAPASSLSRLARCIT